MANKTWIGGDAGGANSWAVAANWSPSGVPVNGDTVLIRSSSTIYDITAGLNQSAVTLAVLEILQDGAVPLIGTLTDYLRISASSLIIGRPNGGIRGAGSGRIKIDLGSNACDAAIYDSSSSSTDGAGRPVIRLLGSHVDNTLEQSGGSVGIANEVLGETANWPSIVLLDGGIGVPSLVLGTGCDVGEVDIGAGNFLSLDTDTSPTKSYTALRNYGGIAQVFGASPIALLEILSTPNRQVLPRFIRNCIGTITQLNLGAGGLFDSTRDARSITITDTNFYGGARLDMRCGRTGTITWTNRATLVGCSSQAVTILTEPEETSLP